MLEIRWITPRRTGKATEYIQTERMRCCGIHSLIVRRLTVLDVPECDGFRRTLALELLYRFF